MKRLFITLMLMIPPMTFAEADVAIYPLSPYLEIGKTNTLLISVSNCGTNNIPVPSGIKREDGTVLPLGESFIWVHYKAIELKNKISPHITSYMSDSVEQTDGGIIEKLLAEDSSGDALEKLLVRNNYLEPGNTITYRINWIPTAEQSELGNYSMVYVSVEFSDCEIKTPPISLYRKKQSNQGMDLTR